MQYYIKNSSGERVSLDDIRIENRNISLPEIPNEVDMISLGYSSAPPLLSENQTSKLLELQKAYEQAIQENVLFTSSNKDTNPYQSNENAAREATAFSLKGSVLPKNYFWVAANNKHVPFTLTDLRGLATAIAEDRWVKFSQLQNKKDAVRQACSIEEVNSISW